MAYNIFERWPFTSFQNLNLDWLLKTTKEAAEKATEAATTVAQYNTRLAGVENDNIRQDRDIMNIQNVDNQQNQRIDALETDVDAHEQTIRSLQGWDQEQETAINALLTRVTNLENDDNDNVKVTAQDFDSTEKNIARNNIGAGTSTVTYDDEDLVLTIEDALTGELETVNLSSATGGYDNIRKLIYNETTGNVVYYDGTTSTPVTGENVIINFMSNGKIFAFMEGGLVNGGNVTYNLYMPLTYDASNGVFFYRIYNNNVEIVRLPMNSNVAVKTTTPIGGNPNAVLYILQTLTEAEKTQARSNIGAGTGTSVVRVNASDGTITITDPNLASGNPMTYQYRTIFPINARYSNGEYTFDKNQADILSAITKGQLPVVKYHTTAGQSDYDVYHEWVFSYYTYDGEDVYIYFSRVDQQGNVSQMRWFASTGKAVVVTSATLPVATGADDGKIPMVNSYGNYQLVTPSASSGTPRVSMASTDTTPALDANKFYVFPVMANLSVSLNSPASNAIVNEYHFRFTSGSTATQFDLPATVEIPDDFDVAADTVYEISIIDNYMVYSSWVVGA